MRTAVRDTRTHNLGSVMARTGTGNLSHMLVSSLTPKGRRGEGVAYKGVEEVGRNPLHDVW